VILDPTGIAMVACQDWHASQRVDELAEALWLAASVDPKVIVEIGCDAGGTLFCWRQLCNDVYGITLADNSPATGGQLYPLNDHGAQVFIGDSHDPAALAWLREHLAGRPIDVLHIDGDHSYRGAVGDLLWYSPLVRDGGLVLLHDAVNRADSRVEVTHLWEQFAAAGSGRLITSKRGRPVGFGVLRKGEDI